MYVRGWGVGMEVPSGFETLCDFSSLSHGNIIPALSVSTQKYLSRKRNQVPCQGLERESPVVLPI